jgi:hypothetical protein
MPLEKHSGLEAERFRPQDAHKCWARLNKTTSLEFLSISFRLGELIAADLFHTGPAMTAGYRDRTLRLSAFNGSKPLCGARFH